MASNEKEIRELTKKILNNQFPDGFTFNEFSGGSLRTRPDLATFLPNSIIFTEIKSDKDTFSRLENQIKDYSYHSNFVYVILDEIHLEKYRKEYQKKSDNIFNYGGNIYFYKDSKIYKAPSNYEGDMKLEQEVKEFHFYEYPTTNISILNFLWKDEKYPFTGFIKGRTKILSETLVIQNLYTAREIIEMSHYVLYNRAKNRNESPTGKMLTYNQGHYDKDIPYKEHRQNLFNDIKCKKSVNQVKTKKIVNKTKPFPWMN